MQSQPSPAPHMYSASAPRLASFSTRTGRPSRSLMRSATRRSPQPGMIAAEPTVPALWIGPGTPMPTPSTRSRAAPLSESTSSTSSVAPSIACSTS